MWVVWWQRWLTSLGARHITRSVICSTWVLFWWLPRWQQLLLRRLRQLRTRHERFLRLALLLPDQVVGRAKQLLQFAQV